MKVKELKAYLEKVQDDEKEVYCYPKDCDPFDPDTTTAVENAFEVLSDWEETGAFEGIYLKLN